jgi:hypothetical protein
MDQISLLEPLEEVESRYSEQLFVLIRGFISIEFAHQLLRTTDDVPIRKVICGDPNISFGEQDFTEEHPIYKFFMNVEVFSLVRLLLQTDKIPNLVCWTSVYELGQYISAHTDGSGDAQIIVCLQAPAQENGGQICVRLTGGEQNLHLTPGDAVIFKASALRHYTTPLTASKHEPTPKRVVAVGRYSV